MKAVAASHKAPRSSRFDLEELQLTLAGPVPVRAVAVLLQQLALLLENGVPPGAALNVLQAQQSHPRLVRTLDIILDRVCKHGWSLSSSLATFPDVFPPTAIMLVKAGETGGDLAGRLRKAGELLERSANLSARIGQALTGPAITIAAGFLILLCIVKFVMPRFLGLYHQMNLELPLLSKIVIGLVGAVNHPAFIVLFLLTLAVLWHFRRELSERVFEMALHAPVVGPWIGVVLCKQFCDIIASLHREGVTLNQSLTMLARTSPHRLHRRYLEAARDRLVLEGSISQAVSTIPYFPSMVSNLCQVGEESGSLDLLLESLARLLEQQVEVVVTQLVTILEPVVVCAIGVVTAILFVGMFLPVYGVLSSLGS